MFWRVVTSLVCTQWGFFKKTFVLVKTKARRQLDVERAHEGGRKRGRKKREREASAVGVLGEFRKKVVFCSGVTLNKPITLRGALPSVCSRTPLLSESAPPCCARFATSAKSRVALTSEKTKEPQRGGRERGGQHAENEGRNGTGRFVYRYVDYNRSHIPCNQNNNRT